MFGQRRRFLTRLVVIGLVSFLAACGGTATVSPSTYAGSPDSAVLTVYVQAAQGQSIDEARATAEDDERVVIEVRVTGEAGTGEETLQAEITLDRALGTREVVDTDGRAIPQA